ncbi:RING finger protein 39-like isoform X1 [Pseudonaja textilis]|uniref:RING finger protein 39-like isoform X1 n=2 Tax=Pseudonaja textilis TaxID=8673 RepID=UPI000EAA5BD8|nr:RING finger protein 39-like isoform X1 [Pseudonaja textilis]
MTQSCSMESKGLVAELQRAAICPACRGHFKDPVILDCDHSYCRACITRYWDVEATKENGPRVVSCPQCKKVFERRNLRTNVKLAVEVKITQHLNAKTAQVPLAPKSKRRRGGWRPTTSIPKEKESFREFCSCYGDMAKPSCPKTDGWKEARPE